MTGVGTVMHSLIHSGLNEFFCTGCWIFLGELYVVRVDWYIVHDASDQADCFSVIGL